MEKKVRYPVGEQSFEELRRRDCLYVDKTRALETLIDSGGKYYFLGRPRRFGKSLFLSMMKCFFQGKRELFRGLHIDSASCDWEPHPVFYLDLNIEKYKSRDILEKVIDNSLRQWEEEYGVPTMEGGLLSVRFSNVIRAAHEKTGKGVVILVDEYDKPLVNNLHDPEQFAFFRDSLASFYSNFKSGADHIRMVFMTGVSRFAHLSVFSGLNNISDISFLDQYSDICGISGQELDDNFQHGLACLAEKFGKTAGEMKSVLKRRYDGYRFSKHGKDIYNPYSLLNVMENLELDNYWIKSGTPSLLADILKSRRVDLGSLFTARCTQTQLEGLDFDNLNPVALIYQTGYVTIKDYSPRGLYTLGLPNEEVEEGFLNYLMPYYANVPDRDSKFLIILFLEDLERGDADMFMTRLRTMLASVPYDMKMDCENNIHNAILILMMLIGLDVKAEYRTSDGRIDLFVRTERYYYIIELKLDGTAVEALDQINRKNYALPFALDGCEVIKIGANFSTSARTVSEWVVQR